MKNKNILHAVFCTGLVILLSQLVNSSPTTIQPQPQDDTTPLGYSPEDEVVIIEEVNPAPVVAEQPQSDNTAETTYPPNVVVDNVSQPLLEVIAQDSQDQSVPVSIVGIKQDDTDDEDEGDGDEDEEEEQQQGERPSQPIGPRPQIVHLVPPKDKEGGLYKLPADGTAPVKVPSISLLQQQKEAAAAVAAAAASAPNPGTNAAATTEAAEPVAEVTSTKSRIRTTQAPKPTTPNMRRRPSTPKPTTTTTRVLSFAEEFNLTNFFHTHTGPQGRADCECGKVPFKLENADAAGVNIYPWAVAIVRSGIFGGGRPHCGATLVNDRFVVTAVHCVLDLYPEDIQVWLTAHNTFHPTDNFLQNDRVVRKNVAEIIMHPNYNRRSQDNDIALLKLGSAVDISSSSYFTPVCLAAAENSYAGLTARVVGWGSASNSNRFTNQRLCKEDVPVLSNDVCIRDTVHGEKITSNMMCAGLLTAERSQECLGDAGSGLTIPNGGRYTLIGVVSWGYSNRQAYSPVVYAKVSGYSDWILHNTRDADWCIV